MHNKSITRIMIREGRVTPDAMRKRLMRVPSHARRRVCSIVWWDLIDGWTSGKMLPKQYSTDNSAGIRWISGQKDLYLERNDYISDAELAVHLETVGYPYDWARERSNTPASNQLKDQRWKHGGEDKAIDSRS